MDWFKMIDIFDSISDYIMEILLVMIKIHPCCNVH
jgi:hypothetical protein